uniref:JmjC domain-containing protein n=1 Tax=Oryza brachyantha TaxID=4533 RepID=J3MYL9_ORYBR
MTVETTALHHWIKPRACWICPRVGLYLHCAHGFPGDGPDCCIAMVLTPKLRLAAAANEEAGRSTRRGGERRLVVEDVTKSIATELIEMKSACSQTSFHKDHYDNIYVVVSGEKHFLLLPPTEHHRLYVRDYPAARYVAEPEGEGDPTLKLELEEPERIVPWSSVDPYPPSPEETAAQVSSFPLYFEGPRPIHCTVRAGEMLYLPSMWFHHVSQSPGPNGLTIAVNYWYDMQFDIKYAYFNFLRSFEINGSKRIDAPEGDLEETTD